MALLADLLQSLLLEPLWTISLAVWLTALVVHKLGPRLEPRGSRPKVVARESDFSRHLTTTVPAFSQEYVPPPWARHPVIQSLLAATILRRADVTFFRTHLQLRDRGLVALDWAAGPCEAAPDDLILLVLPDLGRDSCSVADTCRAALSRGLRPVVLALRGHGGCPLTTPRLQPYGDPSDLRQVVRYLRVQYGAISAVGFGAGADLLLSYLGDTGSSSGLVAAVAVSPLYEPDKLLNDSPWPFGTLRLKSMKKIVAEHGGVLSRAADVKGALEASTWKDVEEKVFWSACSVMSSQQYWERNAPLRDADDMATPLLCVSSEDDPMVPSWAVPMDVFRAYPQLVLLLTEHGGHCGFLAGIGSCPRSWADGVAVDFITATVEFTSRDSALRKCATR
ncbi:protein ABHD15-like [Ornithodoros turicata]|uniref:protein ABHD15-like n=1 Tax=Ornithodoros turicata TaxID=34597 RepID=UPI00313947D4